MLSTFAWRDWRSAIVRMGWPGPSRARDDSTTTPSGGLVESDTDAPAEEARDVPSESCAAGNNATASCGRDNGLVGDVAGTDERGDVANELSAVLFPEPSALDGSGMTRP